MPELSDLGYNQQALSVIITSGSDPAGTAGDAKLFGGEGINGGTAYVRGGEGTGFGGNLNLQAGEGPVGGIVILYGGYGTAGIGGSVSVEGGYSDTDAGGPINITGGGSDAAAGGNVRIRAGQGDTNGHIVMDQLPTADPTVAGALWNDSGTLKISAG